MDPLLLTIIVLAATAIWPLGRWAMEGEGEPVVVGFWVSMTVAVICGAAALMTGEWRRVPAGLWPSAIAMSVGYAVGFWICIMRALQIGPAGPTATVNNMAMAAGVVYGLVVLTPGRATLWTWAGLAGVCAALLLLGMGRPAGDIDNRKTGARWTRLLALGGLLSCVSFISQTHAGTLYPGHKFAFPAIAFGLSALLLLPGLLRCPSRIGRGRERAGGLALGVVNAAIQPLTLLTIKRMGAEVVLPIAVATPILLVLVIGRVFYKERLTPMAWMACVLGALSVAMLAFKG